MPTTTTPAIVFNFPAAKKILADSRSFPFHHIGYTGGRDGQRGQLAQAIDDRDEPTGSLIMQTETRDLKADDKETRPSVVLCYADDKILYRGTFSACRDWLACRPELRGVATAAPLWVPGPREAARAASRASFDLVVKSAICSGR